MAEVNSNSPIHPDLYQRVSVKVEGQLPDFVKQDHPTFVAFLEAYYEYMEQLGKPIEVIGNLQNYVNLDKTTDDFLDYFKQQFGKDLPEAVFASANKPFVLKKLRDFYLSKGSEKSFRFLFRLLHKEEIDFYYPSEDMLRVSDGKYTKNKIIRVIDGSGTNAVYDLIGKQIRGTVSHAEAIVELIIKEKVGSTEVTTMYLSGVRNEFVINDTIVDGSNTYTVGSMVTGYNITNPGNNYIIGDVLTADGGVGDSDATIKVDSLTSGEIATITINDGGSGYVVGDVLTVDNNGVKDVDTRTASFVVKEVTYGSAIPLGAVTRIEIENKGRGYTGLPTISGGTGTGLAVTLTGDNIGGVKTLKINNGGFGYLTNPTIDFSAKGDGTATGTGIISGYENEYNVGWTGDDGFLSAGKYIQDSLYYQLFSYVITSGVSIQNWRDIVKQTVHPAGMAMFGNVQIHGYASTTLNAHTFAPPGLPQQEYTIIFHEGSIEPPVVVKIPVDSCEGEIEYIFLLDADYLSVLDSEGDPPANEEWALVTESITESDDWGLVTTPTFFVAPTVCQIYLKFLGIQYLKNLKGLADYLELTIGATRFGDDGLITDLQETEEGEDFGNLTDEIILSTQLRLGPLRRKLDYWKFRTQGGYSQGVIGTGASADVDAPVAGAITGFSNLVGGTGYVNHAGKSIGPPRVVFDNTGTGGTGAKADITITAGVVTAITVTDGGTGYTSAPTIIITGSGEPGGTESGTGIGPFLSQLTFDWQALGGMKQRNLTNAIITQWDHAVTPDITYGETTNSGFLTNVYADSSKRILPPADGPITLQWYQPGGNP